MYNKFKFKNEEAMWEFVRFAKDDNEDNNRTIAEELGMDIFYVDNTQENEIYKIEGYDNLNDFSPIFTSEEMKEYLTVVSESDGEESYEPPKVNSTKNDLLVLRKELMKQVHRIDEMLESL